MKFNKYTFPDFVDGYDQTIEVYVMHYRKMIEIIADMLPDENLKVLEMGCGSGNLTGRIAGKKRLEITGVDISETLLAEARKKLDMASNVRLRAGDILEINLGKMKFDYIVSLLFIHELYPEERAAIVRKLKRWSKPGTKIIVGDGFYIDDPVERDHNVSLWYEWMVSRGIKSVEALKEIEVHIRDSEYKSAYLSDLLESAGFSFVKLLWSKCFYQVIVYENE
jgi:ubiquinone/menaquinone biosynthesis C-methylase UbiE